ncbi:MULTISPECIES: PA1136 family autoinducer-binding transcriptional regulator [unclassified Pseudomonas]|uniref:PA1136 family autoinducer-binding transcriptional regulator n=1 Tax=unclassified Pseudomonas TaxID=196821 RepID=UPI000EA970C6|nr:MULTISPECIES: PA1136 family autoinducer-binding transcriptional regulator [unclassified Pseudomonas]AYF87665.1 LuxR family transcriptional regulator [Pseudomonas sp. DY-1]MDH4655440.1 LuxR family transcriptional regulator [Pseudomonas sp. BN606]MRK20057.1 LuxR family transcriptional regulator [Pseudomonas sp. JG-B]
MTQDMAEAAFRAALAIESAQTLSVIQESVRASAMPFGYDRFVLFSATSARDEVVERIYWVEGNWFDDQATVDAQTYVRRCPVTRHILEAREPFYWSKVKGNGGELYRVVRTPVGPGIHGLQIPVFGPLGLEGAMSLGGERVDATHRVRLALSIVATAAFFSARRLLESPVGEVYRKLSEREREVLAWIAAGKRQADIAATLGLSERTVENHLRSARRRLGVATTAQAISFAIRNGDLEG